MKPCFCFIQISLAVIRSSMSHAYFGYHNEKYGWTPDNSATCLQITFSPVGGELVKVGQFVLNQLSSLLLFSSTTSSGFHPIFTIDNMEKCEHTFEK